MRLALLSLLVASSAVVAVAALAQAPAVPRDASRATPQPDAGPADLCQELLAYAEKKAVKSSRPPADRAPAPAAAPALRTDEQGTGTQGAGSVNSSSSIDTSSQAARPPTAPVATGAAPEAAASPHASESSGNAGPAVISSSDPSTGLTLAGGVTLQQVRDMARGGDRNACRETVQKMSRAGADLPAALIALAAYEPDPARRR